MESQCIIRLGVSASELVGQQTVELPVSFKCTYRLTRARRLTLLERAITTRAGFLKKEWMAR